MLEISEKFVELTRNDPKLSLNRYVFICQGSQKNLNFLCFKFDKFADYAFCVLC